MHPSIINVLGFTELHCNVEIYQVYFLENLNYQFVDITPCQPRNATQKYVHQRIPVMFTLLKQYMLSSFNYLDVSLYPLR